MPGSPDQNRRDIVEAIEPQQKGVEEEIRAQNPKTVVVSYGRNEKARIAIFTFLRALGLNPVEWSEAIDRAGESFTGNAVQNIFRRTSAVVILMTPDDEARLRPWLLKGKDPDYERGYTPQPRQSVIFEAGMAMAVCPERTILVELGKRRPFSDIEGHHILVLDNAPERRKELVQRLETAGCQVNR